MKILIVDDSLAMQAIVRRGLEQFGYKRLQIKQASNGIEALEVIGAWHPQIVLSDWHMPLMSGIELLIEIKKRNLPLNVGIVTTVSDNERVEYALECGASFVLSKPFEDSQLHKALLPLFQGAPETVEILNEQELKNTSVVLPKISQLQSLLQRVVKQEIQLSALPVQHFNQSKVPSLLALFEDPATKRVRAVAMLDIKATCMLGGIKAQLEVESIESYITEKVVSKVIIDACQQVMQASSLAFLDRTTKASLRLKSVSFVPKSFAKLEMLYGKPHTERIDILCAAPGYKDGYMTIVSS